MSGEGDGEENGGPPHARGFPDKSSDSVGEKISIVLSPVRRKKQIGTKWVKAGFQAEQSEKIPDPIVLPLGSTVTRPWL